VRITGIQGLEGMAATVGRGTLHDPRCMGMY
jgi:hypothetical protein